MSTRTTQKARAVRPISDRNASLSGCKAAGSVRQQNDCNGSTVVAVDKQEILSPVHIVVHNTRTRFAAFEPGLSDLRPGWERCSDSCVETPAVIYVSSNSCDI